MHLTVIQTNFSLQHSGKIIFLQKKNFAELACPQRKASNGNTLSLNNTTKLSAACCGTAAYCVYCTQCRRNRRAYCGFVDWVAFRLLLYGRVGFQALALSPLDQSNGAGIHLSFSLGACICTHALKFKFDIINNFNNCVEQARKSHNFR